MDSREAHTALRTAIDDAELWITDVTAKVTNEDRRRLVERAKQAIRNEVRRIIEENELLTLAKPAGKPTPTAPIVPVSTVDDQDDDDDDRYVDARTSDWTGGRVHQSVMSRGAVAK